MPEKSTHRVEVVPVVLEPHPNADRLAIVRVFGYQCVVAKDEWREGELGAYLPPDSLVDTTRPEFAFLGEHQRIRVRRFRGQMSQGLLVKAPRGTKIGDDVADRLGVTHYEPPVKGESSAPRDKPPPGPFWRRLRWRLHRAWHGLRYVRENRMESGPFTLPKYDVDTWRRYAHLFQDGEHVIVTEKIHGANARYVVVDGRLYCGSRTEWKKDPNAPRPKLWFWQKWIPASTGKGDWWWEAVRRHPEIIDWLHEHPGTILYGEVFGAVQGGFDYGVPAGQVDLRLFDVKLPTGEWLDYDSARFVTPCLPWVPVLYGGPYSREKVLSLADGPSTLPGAKHIREGVVIRPAFERRDEMIGRVQLKLVSDVYYERAAA